MAKTAEQLMEQNPELAKAVTELEEQTLEEQVLAKLKEIEAILTKLDGESIDLSVFLEQIQSFSDEKKAELQALVDKVDDPLGSKTITMKTINYEGAVSSPIVWQEVWMKDSVIKKYGSFFMQGYIDDDTLNVTNGANSVKLPFPSDIEFDTLWVGRYTMYARPKAGQSDVGGISGSLDNYIFVVGWGGSGAIGDGTTSNRFTPYSYKFPSRIKKGMPQGGDNSTPQQNMIVLLENDDVYATGANGWGQFGVGNRTQINSWTKIQRNVKNIFGGSVWCFFVKEDAIYASGFNNVDGVLGVGDTTDKTTPIQLKTITDWTSVDIKCSMLNNGSAYVNTSIMLIDGLLYGAGSNGQYQINSATTSAQTSLFRLNDANGSPLDTPEGTKFVSMPYTTIILIPKDGNTEVYLKGYGTYGIGDGTSATATKLKKITTLDGLDWEVLSTYNLASFGTYIGDAFFLVSEKKKKAYACGYNDQGNLGVGTMGGNVTKLTEVILPHSKSQLEIKVLASNEVSNQTFSLAVIADGEIFSCGSNMSARMKYQTGLLSKVIL